MPFAYKCLGQEPLKIADDGSQAHSTGEATKTYNPALHKYILEIVGKAGEKVKWRCIARELEVEVKSGTNRSQTR